MKDIPVIKGKFYLKRIIAEGEHEHQDFKFAISDARKIARSISAFANRSGGRLLIGVKDNGVIAGVRNEEDIYVIEQAAQLYCNPEQKPDFTAIKAEEGAIVIRVDIPKATKRPVQVREADGSLKAYYRVADENILATPLMVRAWRRKESDRPACLTLSDDERLLIETVNASGAISPADLMRCCMMSRRTTEELIINLFAVGVIDFRFIDRNFAVCPVTPPEES